VNLTGTEVFFKGGVSLRHPVSAHPADDFSIERTPRGGRQLEK